MGAGVGLRWFERNRDTVIETIASHAEMSYMEKIMAGYKKFVDL